MTLKKRWMNFRQRINLRRLIIGIIIVLIIAVAGFLGGIYLRIFDTNELNEKYGLYEIPVIGKYFVPVPTGEPEEKPEEKVQAKPEKSKAIKLTPKEIEKQRKERQAAERKRVSKLARLYNELKPQTAAEILGKLEDDVAIAILQRMDESQAAKVLGKLDAARAATLTKEIYVGKTPNMSSAGDIPLDQLKAAENAVAQANER